METAGGLGLTTDEPEADTPDEALTSVRARASARVVVAAAAVAWMTALYVVLAPESFGLTPNPLDPMFYTGYAINFDDIMNAVRDRHYFVSRWSSYYPMFLAARWFGPSPGRLLVRLLVAVAIAISIWRVRADWRWSTRLMVATLIVTMPMFVRAFFTDYVEWTVVGLGVWLVALCVRTRQTMWTTACIGVLAGMIVVANPYGLTVVGLPAAAAVLFGWGRWRHRIAAASAMVAIAAVVVLGGLLLFRIRYSIDNVYQPTIDFVRNVAGPDTLRSPRLEWLGSFTWLYATPFFLLVVLILVRRRVVSLGRSELVAVALCGLQYLYHWLDQFGRRGNGLEISYYWSFAYPTFGVAVALVAAQLARTCRDRTVLALTVGWLALLVVGVPDRLRLPAHGLAIVVLLLAAVVVVVISVRSRAGALAVMLVAIGFTQIAAPAYDPTSYHPFNASPRYDQVFGSDGDFSERVFEEAVWFADEMDRVPNDASTSFVALDGWAGSIVGLYAPHVTNRFAGGDQDGTGLPPSLIAEIRLGFRPVLAVYGEPAKVQQVVDTFPDEVGVGRQVLDVTNDGGLGYRLAVFSMPDAARLPFSFEASALPRMTGRARGEAVVVTPGFDTVGFVTYGPYLELAPGNYVATVRYRTDAAPGTVVGTFDVASPEEGGRGAVDLVGSDGSIVARSVTFEVTAAGGRWEFRTAWNGTASLTIESITLGSG